MGKIIDFDKSKYPSIYWVLLKNETVRPFKHFSLINNSLAPLAIIKAEIHHLHETKEKGYYPFYSYFILNKQEKESFLSYEGLHAAFEGPEEWGERKVNMRKINVRLWNDDGYERIEEIEFDRDNTNEQLPFGLFFLLKEIKNEGGIQAYFLKKELADLQQRFNRSSTDFFIYLDRSKQLEQKIKALYIEVFKEKIKKSVDELMWRWELKESSAYHIMNLTKEEWGAIKGSQ